MLLGRESARGCLALRLNISPAAHSPSSNHGCSGHTSQQVQDKDEGRKEQSPRECWGPGMHDPARPTAQVTFRKSFNCFQGFLYQQ